MKTQSTTVRRLGYIAVAVGITLFSGCSQHAGSRNTDQNQAVLQSTMQQANAMAAWRAAHPGQEHP